MLCLPFLREEQSPGPLTCCLALSGLSNLPWSGAQLMLNEPLRRSAGSEETLCGGPGIHLFVLVLVKKKTKTNKQQTKTNWQIVTGSRFLLARCQLSPLPDLCLLTAVSFKFDPFHFALPR